MNILYIKNEFDLSDKLLYFYNTAKEYKASRIVLLNTYNPQSTLNAVRFAVNILKPNIYGNEEVAYIHGELLEVPYQNIAYKGIEYFKENCNKYKHDIPIEIWSDYSSPKIYW